MNFGSVSETLTASHLAIMGKTGSGKTYAAKVIVEHLLLDDAARVCIIDPTGVWWGLKTFSKTVAVLGGDEKYQDLPLDESHAAAVAQLVGSGKLPAVVLDLSAMTINGQHRFVERFLEELYRAANKGVLHLVIDEADEFAPQSGAPGTERLLGATARIVQRGRAKGFRAVLISQRPAVLNKRVLTQCNAIIAMRLIAPQDRSAIKEWVKGQADETAAETMLASLAGLKRGEGWIWAPDSDLGLKRAVFPTIASFDSGKTPDGSSSPEVKVSAADLRDVRAALEAATNQVKIRDPEALKKRVAELEAKLVQTPQPKPIDVDPILTALSGLVSILDDVKERITRAFNATKALSQGSTGVTATQIRSQPARVPEESRPLGESAPRGGVFFMDVDLKNHPALEGLSGSSRRLLLAFIRLRMTLGTPVRVEMGGFLAGLNPNGGHFTNTIGPLFSRDLLRRDGSRLVDFSDATPTSLFEGVSHFVSEHEYHQAIRASLSGRTRDIFDVILKKGSATNEEIGEAVGIDPNGGHFTNCIGPLSTLGLITRSKGHNYATELMWRRAQ